jgi:hypothetical protein
MYEGIEGIQYKTGTWQLTRFRVVTTILKNEAPPVQIHTCWFHRSNPSYGNGLREGLP